MAELTRACSRFITSISFGTSALFSVHNKSNVDTASTKHCSATKGGSQQGRERGYHLGGVGSSERPCKAIFPYSMRGVHMHGYVGTNSDTDQRTHQQWTRLVLRPALPFWLRSSVQLRRVSEDWMDKPAPWTTLPPLPLVSIVVLHWLSVCRVPDCGGLPWLPPPLWMASLQAACCSTHLHYCWVISLNVYATEGGKRLCVLTASTSMASCSLVGSN